MLLATPDHETVRAVIDGAFAQPARRVEARIATLLAGVAAEWTSQQPSLSVLFDALNGFIAGGGKRLRPLFCIWGAVGAGADVDDSDVIDTAAALELLHAFALIHDDVMDGSDTRRARPSLHRQFEAMHEADGLKGEGRRFGEGLAVLAGDLAFVLADVLVDGLPRPAREVWHQLRVELTMGQWIDMVGAARGDRCADLAHWVAAYKSGRYTVERPLHLGAAVVGRADLMASYSAIGRPLGEAFQLRDDLLGVLGDPACTGKPVGTDLREGKPTLVLAVASQLADATGRRRLARAGASDLSDDEVLELCRLVESSGAVDVVEREIDTLVGRAIDALDRCVLQPGAVDALHGLCRLAAWRER
jgi:geranylgeranyl diphosphate synthase, type I